MQQQIILTSLPLTDLRGMIIDCVSACLKAYTSSEVTILPNRVESETTFDLTGLANYLNCSLPDIRGLRKQGVLPFYRVGRKVYFKKSEVDSIGRVAAIGEKKKGIKF